MATPVKLHVYDVSQGAARMMAPLLLGRPLDGVWHTAVVVYGNEYFFGGDGINYCPPCGTVLGRPTQVVELGQTEIPLDMFHEYLLELSMGPFCGLAYHLLDHNCNTFSNEVAQFLTGQPIPEHITNLPAEIMATPFGQMLRPWIDMMMTMSPATGSTATHIGPNPPVPSTVSPQSPDATPSNDQKSATPENTKASQNSSTQQPKSSDPDGKGTAQMDNNSDLD